MERNSNILQELPDWLLRYLLGQVDSEEEKKLRAVERMYGLSHFTKEEIIERLKTPEQFNTAEAFLTFNKKCLKSQRRLRVRYWSVAASIVLLIGLSYFGYQQIPFHSEQKTYISPGKLQATITLANGQMVDLHSGQQQLEEQDGTSIVQDSGCLVYSSVLSGKKTLYNTVSVPKGGEYRLCLSDGTKVWLNADSEIRYPVIFSKESRKVQLVGEAYFEVTADAHRPFFVQTTGGEIQVLGTGFNVRNYPEEDQTVTTLVHGKVAYTDMANQIVVLTPGEQTIGQSGQQTILQQVNTDYYTSWKDGKYIFKSMTLEKIMQELSRWYDITVFYQHPEVKSFHFTGDLRRYEYVETFLQFLELGGDVRFDIKGKTVIVSKK
jgi:anti-fecI sigma factor, fecR